MVNGTTPASVATAKGEFGPKLSGADRPVSFDFLRVASATAPQEHPAIRAGSSPDRTGRSGLFPFVLDDISGGMRPLSTIGSYGFDKTLTFYNEGLMIHIPGQVSLPYLLTTQQGIVTADFSGYNDLNRRVHSALWTAADGLRTIHGIGPFIIKDTSVSDPALAVPATNDNVTNNITAMWTGPFGANAQTLIIGTDGQTDDIKYTTDPTASSISWTSLVTYANANDRCWGGAWMPELGSGWHVFMGKINNVAGWYAFRATDTAPLTITTLAPVVWEATKDEPGDLSSTSQDLTFRTWLTPFPDTGGSGEWSTPGNIFSSNNTYATTTLAAGEDITDDLQAYNPDLSNLPKAVKILGIEAKVEIKANTLVEEPGLDTLSLKVSNANTAITAGNFTALGRTVAATTLFPITAADALYTTGDSTQLWGENWTREMLQQLSVVVRAVHETGAGTTTFTVDHLYATIYYQFLGTQVVAQQGGFTIGPMPSDPLTLPTIEPEFDQEGLITARRILLLNRFAFDSEGDRPVMAEIVRPPLTMAYVGIAQHFQGGVLCIGGSNSTVWNECKLVDSQGIVRNLNMPKTHNGQTVTAVRAETVGNALLVTVTKTDGTDAQLWVFFDGAWNALGPLQSKSLAIASRPIYWAETVRNLEQNYLYTFIPNSTTNLHGTRQFVQPGLFDDPFLTHPTENRHPGPLAVTLPILDMGTMETKKALLTAQAQSFKLDDNTLYGTAQIEVDTTGDLTLAVPEVNVTFGTAVGQTDPFVDAAINEAVDKPGVNMPTAIIRLTLDSDGTLGSPNAKSPQPLPIVFWLTGQWPFDTEMQVFLPQNQRPGTNINDIVTRLEEMAETKTSHRLAYEGLDGAMVPMVAAFVAKQVVQNRRMTLLDRAGRPVTDEYSGVIVAFRTLPGEIGA